MAFSGRTPESLIPRSDSRNPATTCKGITKSGRPCRRAIDAKADDGVLAVVSVANDSDEEDTGAAAYFCWQHKDQAESLMEQNTPGIGRHDTQLYPLKERSSIDTLVARLGVLDIEEPSETQAEASRRRRQNRQNGSAGRPPKKINRPPTWSQVQGPLMSVPSDVMASQKHSRPSAQPQRKKQSFWWSLCCGEADSTRIEVVKPKIRINQQPNMTTNQNMDDFLRPQGSQQSRPSVSSAPRPQSSSLPPRKSFNKTDSNPSGTPLALSYIPKTVPPALASTLLAEMTKPISQHDEDGYIYIFWLTPESLGPAPSSTASALLTPPSRPDQGRRTSDVLRQYSVKNQQQTTRQRSASAVSQTSTKDNTILLKIGRANNVTRRMNEWTRQCGYSLSLVRYYPYVPSSATPSPSPSPKGSPASSRQQSYAASRKVPNAHRVERLIHLELAEKRVIRKCDACGKEHKEWFEVDANRDGIKAIDEVIKRWVDWAEKSNDS